MKTEAEFRVGTSATREEAEKYLHYISLSLSLILIVLCFEIFICIQTTLLLLLFVEEEEEEKSQAPRPISLPLLPPPPVTLFRLSLFSSPLTHSLTNFLLLLDFLSSRILKKHHLGYFSYLHPSLLLPKNIFLKSIYSLFPV